MQIPDQYIKNYQPERILRAKKSFILSAIFLETGKELKIEVPKKGAIYITGELKKSLPFKRNKDEIKISEAYFLSIEIGLEMRNLLSFSKKDLDELQKNKLVEEVFL